MTLRPTPDDRPPATEQLRESIEHLRRSVILGRALGTQPESVDQLLQLADLALANTEVFP